MKNTLLISRLLLICSGAAGLHAVGNALQHSMTMAMLYIAIVLWLLLLMHLNNRDSFRFIPWLILLSLSLVLVSLGSYIPRENGLHLFFLPLLCSTFILFDHKQQWEKTLGSGIALGSYLLLEISDFKVFGAVTPLEQQNSISFVVNFLTTGVLLFLILRYITQAHYKAEQEVQEQNDLLSKTNEELDRFVYSTSHDLRAPLLSISGLLELLEKKPVPESIRPYLQMVQDRIGNLNNFINDITLYARNARTPLQLSSVALHPFIQEVLVSHSHLHPQHNIELRQLTDLQTVVTMDSCRLLTIVNNLVSNALKYHNLEQPKPYVVVGAEVADNQLHLWVEDNGPGIAPAVQERMFEMFYRGNSRSSGSGLGLYIVKEALDKLGGTIEVHSKPGVGSTFRVQIPIHNTEQYAAEDAAENVTALQA